MQLFLHYEKTPQFVEKNEKTYNFAQIQRKISMLSRK